MARVLIVDDDANMRSMLATVLRAAGHDVDAAHEGAEAIKRHQAVPAELIVMDIFMPGMEGLEAIQSIRRVDRKVRILAISGVDIGNPLGVAMRLGANRMLEKPFLPHQILTSVNELLKAKP